MASLKVTVSELMVTFVVITFPVCFAAVGLSHVTSSGSAVAQTAVASPAVSLLARVRTITETVFLLWQTLGYSDADSVPSSHRLSPYGPSQPVPPSPGLASVADLSSFDCSQANIRLHLVSGVSLRGPSVHVSIVWLVSTFSTSISKSRRSSGVEELYFARDSRGKWKCYASWKGYYHLGLLYLLNFYLQRESHWDSEFRFQHVSDLITWSAFTRSVFTCSHHVFPYLSLVLSVANGPTFPLCM